MDSFHARSKKAKSGGRPAGPALTPARDHDGVARADALLVERGLAPSRAVAQRMIESGRVSWRRGHGEEAVTKSSLSLPLDAELSVVADADDRYVSRGGLKLAGALKRSGINPDGMICLDVGQSTGGFTDCLLQAGARRVIGVDVGHTQLHPTLRNDERVVGREGVNARQMDAASLGEDFPPGGFNLIVADLSFISLSKVLPQLPPLLAAEGQMLLLIKPQFEVGAENIGKGGVVKDQSLYAKVEADFRAAAAVENMKVCGWFDSPLIGGGVGNMTGNREFFLWIKPESNKRPPPPILPLAAEATN